VTRDVLTQAAYNSAVKALKPDFLFDNRLSEYNQLLRVSYNGYLGVRSRYPEFLAYKQSQGSSMQPLDPDSVFDNPRSMSSAPGGQMVRDTVGRFIFTQRTVLPPNWRYVGSRELYDHLAALNPAQEESFWQQVQLDGVISVAMLRQVEEQLKIEQGKYANSRPYTLDILGEVRDFRIMLGLQYLVQLARECGIGSTFEPVLSLPLGSNVVSLSEITRMYETLVTGSRHDVADAQTLALAELDGNYDPDGAAIIERIETPEGRVVYSRQVAKTRVLDAKNAAAVANILQNTITYGTGRYAWENVRLHSEDPDREKVLARKNLPYPLLGKTGTANDYRNAAFVGYVPVLSPDASALTLQGGYTVGVYTGYDTNLPMVKSGTRVSGSLGALPAWSDIAQSLLDAEKIGDRLDIVDLTFNGLPLQYPDVQQFFVPVNPQQGGAMVPGAGGARQSTPPGRPASLSFGVVTDSGYFEPERQFAPFWKNH
jgi:penicillin-binding protein 1A